MSYQQYTRFRTTLDFRSPISMERIKQLTSGDRRYLLRFFHFRRKQFGELWSTDEKK